MATNLTRRELGKLAGTGAFMISAPAIGVSTSAADVTAGNTTVAQAATQADEKGRATNHSSDIAMQRADELLRQMTVEEKAMQLSCIVPIAVLGADGPMHSQLDALLGQGIGHIAGPGLIGHKTPDTLAKSVNAIQRYLVTETRLKIPALVHNEALNGVVSPGFTAFPTAIGLAATWDPAAVEEMADLMRRQMRAVGMLHALAPVMDVARDARWGRVTETYGEDPYLVSAMSVAFTRGMQGEDLREGVLVCAKHFLGYAVTDAGQNMAATAVGPRELYDVYARPFEAAIRLAGLAGVMASYSEFEGVPIHVSRAVLTDILRGRMGFTGTVVSDYNGVGWAQTRQLVAPSPEDVGALALAAAHADVEQYARSEYGAVSLADAVRKLLPDAEVRTVAGTGVLPAQPTDIPAALAAARDADVVILYIGGKGGWYGDDLTEKEGVDTADIDLPQQQVELVNAVTAVGKPTVAVVSMGRPQGLAAVIDKLPAVLTAYYGGPHQGSALADAIFGITNPEGKLPITIPRHVGQVPIHHGQKWGSGYRRTKADIHPGYLDMPSTPLFAFGHGLSYTTFDYGPLELESDTVDVSGELRLSLAVTNTGKQRGTEIVQLYAADMATGVTLPAQQLIGFARLDLEPGTSKTVAFTVPMSLLAYTGLSGDLVMEPGSVEVSAGSSSSDIRSSATFSVTGQTRLIEGADRAFLSVATVGT